MQIQWTVKDTEEQAKTLKAFLKRRQISKRLLSKIKYRGGELKVNNRPVRVREPLAAGDLVTLVLPKETGSENLSVSGQPIDIVYEDEHYLLLNKPFGVASVPSALYPDDTMASRVKGYIRRQNYYHQTVHIVSRLDRNTSGIMIFAKHALAHSYLDQLLQKQEVYKEYTAFTADRIKQNTGMIDAPIARSTGSIIERSIDPNGKPSRTEYWLTKLYDGASQVRVQLHTGRTHQIRVHFAHIGHPLLGDTLYGSSRPQLIDRQALHCSKIIFKHPFTEKQLSVKAPLPKDLKDLECRLTKKDH